MEVELPPDMETKLARVAAERGCDRAALAKEAIARRLDYEAWFLQEVNTGLAAADRGEFVEHAAVRALIDSQYPG
jgi:predicted transcriptional regulator